MSWATRTDKFGGIPKNFAKAMTAEKRRERAQRAHFRSMKREFARAVDYGDELESREYSEQEIAFGPHRRHSCWLPLALTLRAPSLQPDHRSAALNTRP